MFYLLAATSLLLVLLIAADGVRKGLDTIVPDYYRHTASLAIALSEAAHGTTGMVGLVEVEKSLDKSGYGINPNRRLMAVLNTASGTGRRGIARRSRSYDRRSQQDVRPRAQRNRDDRLLLCRIQIVRLSRPIDLCALYRHSRRHGALLHRLISPSRDIHCSIHFVFAAAADRTRRAAFQQFRLRPADQQPHAAVPVALSGAVLPDPGRSRPRFSFDRRHWGGDRRSGFCLRGQCADLCLLAGRTAARARRPDRGGAPVALAIAAARAPYPLVRLSRAGVRAERRDPDPKPSLAARRCGLRLGDVFRAWLLAGLRCQYHAVVPMAHSGTRTGLRRNHPDSDAYAGALLRIKIKERGERWTIIWPATIGTKASAILWPGKSCSICGATIPAS